MTHNDIRQKYLDFFIKRGHKVIPSASLVPENDPTTLFISSGMQPLISYLLGEKHSLGARLVNSQKSFRSQDIEEVGDNRHTTFFEMLGNWSLGDPARNAAHSVARPHDSQQRVGQAGGYFKKEQLPWFFEFLTKELNLDPHKLYVTVFAGNESVPKDTESIEIWQEIFHNVGIEAKEGERIFTYGVDKNWWSRSGVPANMPAGEPGGPDSEVFFDFGTLHDPKFGEKCHPNCNCGRFMEIGNSVFMQYQKQTNGALMEMKNKNVDFGGGLERLVAASNNNPDIFRTDLFENIIKTLEEITAKNYSDKKNQIAMRIIADHLKAATFLIADGVIPSNKTQGYVLRRLIRRSTIKLYELTQTVSNTHIEAICDSVIDTYEGVNYLNGEADKKRVRLEVGSEVLRFTKTLDKGMRAIEKIQTIDGQIAFDLYQTFGFPFEITAELFSQKGQKIDKDQFELEFRKHQEISRSAAKGMFRGGLQDNNEATTKLHTATHLLQQALRSVLGNHVRQKGSNITAERLRFDFSHHQKLTLEEINKITAMVNEKIQENLAVSMEIVPLPRALALGALTVPEAKYPEMVKVYSIKDFSKEVCGGPHVDFTGSLGMFKIDKEEALGSAGRRIYATLG